MKRLLIAEDEADIRFLLVKALEDHYLCETVEDGILALESLRRSPPDAIITDLKMPGAGGLEVLAAAHHLDPYLPVLIITGYGSMHSAVEALRLGAYDYIQKPFEDLARLHASLDHAIEIASLRKENQRLAAELRQARQELNDHMAGCSSRAALANRQKQRS